jgi:hypothetical protein
MKPKALVSMKMIKKTFRFSDLVLKRRCEKFMNDGGFEGLKK